MIIAISNHKGGVGKTTTVANIAAGLHRMGKRVLVVDIDPQANLSQSFGSTHHESNIYGAIRGMYPAAPIPVLPGLDIVPSTLDLSGAEVELSGEAGREYILRDVLAPLRRRYDYILVDCPPSLGLLTINALTAADEVLIPMQAHYLAMQGVAKLTEVVDKIRKRLNKTLRIGGVVITHYDGRKVLHRDVAETIRSHFKDSTYTTMVRDNIALAEAPAHGVDIFRYETKSNGATDYAALCKEIIKRGRK